MVYLKMLVKSQQKLQNCMLKVNSKNIASSRTDASYLTMIDT